MATVTQGNKLIRFGNDTAKYYVPEEITELADLAFADSDRLISLQIPDSVSVIGNYVFATCYSLREIRLPASVTRIGAGLFQKCWNIREIALPEGMTALGTDMFEGCHALYSIHIPDSLDVVERTAFSSCRSLTKVYIDPARIRLLPPSARYLAALTYMEEHAPGDGNDLIDEFFDGRRKSLLDLAINRRSTEAVRYMLGRGLISYEALSEYLGKAVRTGRVEITALMLDSFRDNQSGSIDPDPFA